MVPRLYRALIYISAGHAEPRPLLGRAERPNSVFIFQIDGSFATGTNSKVHLINGALACNVFWKVEGPVAMGPGTTMRGTIVANEAAITMAAGDTLEGRALSINGAVGVSETMAYMPLGCGVPELTGPIAPPLGTTACFGLFSADGAVTNAGITAVAGDVGTNVGLTTGFDPLLVSGTVHPSPDPATAQAAADLTVVYNLVNAMQEDIILMRPDLFGHDLVLTPHTYLMNGAVSFTDTLYLNAQGDSNAVFVIKTMGAFTTSTNARVKLINEARADNVYWLVNGAVDINDGSIFNGTFISNGAVNMRTGVVLNGRMLNMVGELNTFSMDVNYAWRKRSVFRHHPRQRYRMSG
jgi:formylmethanofuran dehydrogenase subunit C